MPNASATQAFAEFTSPASPLEFLADIVEQLPIEGFKVVVQILMDFPADSFPVKSYLSWRQVADLNMMVDAKEQKDVP